MSTYLFPSTPSRLMATTRTLHYTYPVGHQILIMLQLHNNSYDHDYQVIQYVQLWQELQLATSHHGPPLPDYVLANLWFKMLGTIHNQWLVILQVNNPSKPLQHLVQQFFSLLHLLGPKVKLKQAHVPNCIQTGDGLAHYLQLDLTLPRLMLPCDYLHQFQLTLSTLDHLELLWEPPITTTEACTIFLHSFPHNMVLMFHNFLKLSFTPPDLTLCNINNAMENILSIKPCKSPHHATTYHSPPQSIPSCNPHDNHTNEQEPLLPIVLHSHTGPATFTPELSNSNHNGTIQGYLYWARFPPSQQPPASLMFQHFNHFLLSKLHLLNQEEANLLEWHNHILSCMDHDRYCTLDGSPNSSRCQRPIQPLQLRPSQTVMVPL